MSEKRKIYTLVGAGILLGVGLLIAAWQDKTLQTPVVQNPEIRAGATPSSLNEDNLLKTDENRVFIQRPDFSNSDNQSKLPDSLEKPPSNNDLETIQPQLKDKRSLPTEQEVFDRLWPPSYRSNLIMFQDLMIKDGFMPEREKNIQIDTDEEVYAILLKIIDFAALQHWITNDKAVAFRRGAGEILPDLIREERKSLEMGRNMTGILLGQPQLASQSKTGRSLLEDILEGLNYFLGARTANAGWTTTSSVGDCYKDDNPESIVPGFNAWAPCCNCGLYCIAYYCEYVPDCGPYSTQCNVPLGCLNLICAAWQNAIWDYMTGICGCG